MSVRNIFLIKLKKDININLVYNELDEFMMNNKFGIQFEPKNYQNEILELLECNSNYFTLTNDKNSIECEDIFETYDSFEYAISFPKCEFKKREFEFLFNKLNFIDEIVKIILKQENVESIEVYVSDQYSISLNDYSKVIMVSDQKFVKALIESYNPTKKDNFFGIKTVKFIIKADGTSSSPKD